MRFIVFLLASLTLLLFGGGVDGRLCTPYSVIKSGCETCWCNGSGDGIEFCSRENCPGGELEKICEPNSVYKRDCNTCRCNHDGTEEYCTKMRCVPEEDHFTRYIGWFGLGEQ